MKEKENKEIPTHVFYSSNEESNCPIISKLVKLGKELSKINLQLNENKALLSARFGKRVIINGIESNIKELKQNDFLEIIDYDPIRRVLLLMGPKDPLDYTTIHWFILHARKEINFVLSIKIDIFKEKKNKNIPVIEKKYPKDSIEETKEVLKSLRDSNVIIIKDQLILFVGENIEKIKENVFKTIEEFK